MPSSLSLAVLVAFTVFPAVLPAQEPANGRLGIVSVPLANVREAPEPKSPIVTQVLLADEIRILEKQEYRYRIAIPGQGGREGWIQQEALQVPRDKGKAYLQAERTWIVITVPKTRALVLDKSGNHNLPLYGGTRLPVLEQTADGYKVQFPDRTTAIIDAADVAPVKAVNPLFLDVAPADVAKTARKFLGVRGFAGGVTAQGLDTRGLIYAVYRIHGIDLDVERPALAARAAKVAKKDLLPGDVLVFYGGELGLYVDNGRFLYVPRKSAVQYGGIFDRRFAGALQYGLRILGEDPEQRKAPKDLTADEILIYQSLAADRPLPARIAYWAARFVGTPYDPDPLGLYVRTNRIVADEKADCMYHTFRSVELAMTETPDKAVAKALDLRFQTKGVVQDGLVKNYDERYQYGEDMIWSGKWGTNITAELGATRSIPGSRGKDMVEILPASALQTRALRSLLRDGDILFWVKDPKKRVVEEIVAHLSIVRVKNGKPYVIHAAGSKDNATRPGGGVVKEVLFADYVRDMKFIGAFVTRFGDGQGK